MPARTLPTPSEIADAIFALPRADTHAIAWGEARRAVQHHVGTIPSRAAAWLNQALDGDTPLLCRATVSDDGLVLVLRDPVVVDGTELSGGEQMHLRIGPDGGFWDRDDRPSMEAASWVLTPTALHAMVRRARDRKLASAAVREATTIVKQSAIDMEHGPALRHLRGLLDLAGITPDAKTLRASASEGRQPAMVTFNLYGADIGRLGDLAQRLGVQPLDPEGY